MGWSFIPNTTRQSIIDKLVRFEENEHGVCETLRHSLRGNVLWSIVSWTDKKTGITRKIITCHLLAKDGNDWGYKSLDEAMGPFYYSCPVSYFKEVPVANQEWRDEVLEHHQRKNRKFKIGDKLILVDGCKAPFVIVDEIRPRLIIGVYIDTRYHIKRNLVKSVEHPQKDKAA